MFTPEMLESIKKVEATRAERMGMEPRRMTAEEKDELLKAYHPDYRPEGFKEIKIGPNKGQKAPAELADLLHSNSRLLRENIDLTKIDYDVDVLVIGGGMAGLLCAYQLKKAGVDCMVAERKRIASGITGNTTAKVTCQHGLIYSKLAKKGGLEAAKLYLQANEEALSEYRRLCAENPCDFEDHSHTVYSRQDLHTLEEELAVLSKLNYPAELAGGLPLPFPTIGGIRFPRQAQCHPEYGK